jgi:hypothetical protein
VLAAPASFVPRARCAGWYVTVGRPACSAVCKRSRARNPDSPRPARPTRRSRRSGHSRTRREGSRHTEEWSRPWPVCTSGGGALGIDVSKESISVASRETTGESERGGPGLRSRRTVRRLGTRFVWAARPEISSMSTPPAGCRYLRGVTGGGWRRCRRGWQSGLLDAAAARPPRHWFPLRVENRGAAATSR